MDLYDVVASGAGVLTSILTFFLHRQSVRIDRIDMHLSNVRIEIARQQQENKELQTHIHRIDKNLDELFKKMEEILFVVRKNGKN
jgi:septal ring factor EnvC (AmiA/AmiB activator)